MLYAAGNDLVSLWQSHQRNRYDNESLQGYASANPEPEKLQSHVPEKTNVLPRPDQSKCREQVISVPPIAKLTAADLMKKALGDFIGDGR